MAKKYKSDVIDEIWGKTYGFVHQKKYVAKQYCIKNDIPLQRPELSEESQEVASTVDVEVTPEPSNYTELDEIKEMLKIQGEAIDLLMQRQYERDSQRTIDQVEPSGTVAEPTNDAMTFNFKDQKNGFKLHMDLERFISILEDNPDQFEVDIKIKRIEK